MQGKDIRNKFTDGLFLYLHLLNISNKKFDKDLNKPEYNEILSADGFADSRDINEATTDIRSF
ncbi:hypothetical protein AM1_A0286 (plasmid) [Acaryochloris marina MBIC11017]|uniref:Uncharacterized protein n=1 Tax=Acaryochloris marina (strain MBIC 11017) TaxID=329726 RepID=A8ZKT6_ACAM1|nr:hypothetical protein AM1_A0286 [Acaryochloris marina MBIC11017]BDM83464.1 hypothetical protein AM10699_63250 [Acaryochloris marina MBIC10699]